MFAPKVAKPQTKAAVDSTNHFPRRHSTLLTHRPGNDFVEQARMPQSTGGDQAMLRLLAQRTGAQSRDEPGADHEQKAETDSMTAREAPRGVAWDFSKIPVFPPDRTDQSHARSALTANVLRSPVLQNGIDGSEGASEAAAPYEWYFARPASAGVPPPDGVRQQVESATGIALGHVRVHTDAHAATQSALLGARAFTVGGDVFLGSRGTAADESLLAHELAHAAQQGAREIPAGLLPVNPPGGSAELEAAAVSRLALNGRRASISHGAASVARATVSGYGAKSQLELERSEIEKAQAQAPGLHRLDKLYAVLEDPTVQSRFKSSSEERDAVLDVAWQIRPATLSADVEKVVSIPVRGTSPALLYRFTFTPKTPGAKTAKDQIAIKFESEGAGAAIVTPVAVAGATRPKRLSGSGFAGSNSVDYFNKHADEGQQLFSWIAAQKSDAYDQLLVTSETTGAGAGAKKHESSLRVYKGKGDPEINADLLGEFRLDEKKPGADYRRDFADDLIAAAQTKGDPGQKTKPDKLGTVTGISGFPTDEQFSVKFFAYSLFETSTAGGKTTPGLRDAESKGVVNVANSKKQVLIRVSIASATTKNTYDMEVVRIGEVGKDAEIDPAKAKPDVGRAAGFPVTGDTAAVSGFLGKRYKALTGVTGKDPAAIRGAANKLLETQAKTAAYFSTNYGVSVLDGAAGATRLQNVNKLDAAQTKDNMEEFSEPELWALELAFETLSDPLLKALEGTAFVRQTVQIVDKGSSATPRFIRSTEHAGLTPGSGVAKDRTVILFNNFHDTEKTSFMGSTKHGILPMLDFTILHEIGHALDQVTSARDAFNKKFPALRGFTDYARGDKTKEAFEEAFAIFQGDPEWLKANHKDVFDWFTSFASSGTP